VSPADHGRTAVYEAEKAAFLGTALEVDIGVAVAVDLANEVVATAWWPGPSVTARAARSDAGSSSSRSGSGSTGVVIRIAAGQATPATVAHELAHALAGVRRGHDARYRRAYLDVVRVLTNLKHSERRHDLHVGQLSEAFRAFGLEVGQRQWPEPIGFGAPIAL